MSERIHARACFRAETHSRAQERLQFGVVEPDRLTQVDLIQDEDGFCTRTRGEDLIVLGFERAGSVEYSNEKVGFVDSVQGPRNPFLFDRVGLASYTGCVTKQNGDLAQE